MKPEEIETQTKNIIDMAHCIINKLEKTTLLLGDLDETFYCFEEPNEKNARTILNEYKNATLRHEMIIDILAGLSPELNEIIETAKNITK